MFSIRFRVRLSVYVCESMSIRVLVFACVCVVCACPFLCTSESAHVCICATNLLHITYVNSLSFARKEFRVSIIFCFAPPPISVSFHYFFIILLFFPSTIPSFRPRPYFLLCFLLEMCLFPLVLLGRDFIHTL